VGVVGLGLIGGSLLRRLATAPGLEVRGFDAAPEVRSAVTAEGFDVDPGLAGWAEVVAVSVAPRATASALVGALGAGDAVVFDTASVKAPVVAAVRAAAAPAAMARYVPAHPLAGAERGGWRASRADLLDAAVWAVCPHDLAAPPEPLATAARVLDTLDARLAFCSPEDHDAAVARSSHLPHVVANALAATIDTPLAAVLSGGALRDATRVAGADAGMWSEILALNAPAVAEALREFEDGLGDAWRRVRAGDPAGWGPGAQAHRAIEALRWEERAWHSRRLGGRVWEQLLAESAQGRLARRLRLEGDELWGEVG